MSKYRVISGPYFPVFGLNTEIYEVLSSNTEKYGPEITPYLDTFHAVSSDESDSDDSQYARFKIVTEDEKFKWKLSKGMASYANKYFE